MATNRMSRFERFIGTWNTTGEVFATDETPATTLVATDTYRWLPGGHFILHDVDARFGGAPTRSTEIMGYDAEAGRYVARSFDDRGGIEASAIELRGRHWRIIGATTRFDGCFDATGDRLAGLWEIRARRGGWRPWIDLVLERA